MTEEAELTPAQHLRALLTRAQNPFDVSDATLTRLETALLHRVELYSSRQRTRPAPALRCSTHRHGFLLADGAGVVLWELRHDGGRCAGEPPLTEVYEDEPSLRRAEQRVQGHEPRVRHIGLGPFDGPGVFDAFGPLEEFGPFRGPGGPESAADGVQSGAVPRFSAGARRGREYTGRNSPEHARRLLRRAENSDRPGDETLRLLATAQRHEIMHVPKPHALARQWHIWCSVYEHAFLLEDGREVSLYELEHDLSGTGRLVCEVYLEECVADQAAHRRARDHGIG